jgi:hypothetical protein
MPLDNFLPGRVSSRLIRSFINFDGKDAIELRGSSQAEMQSKGVAALWHLLQDREKGYAYLGDEVGMGKTRQAMGVIATQFLSNPNSHVVIVCPGRTLQEQWAREWDAFIRTCYKGKDNRLTSMLDGSPVQAPESHDRLRDFAQALLLNESRIHLLRYSSFSRPIWFGEARHGSCRDILDVYEECLSEIGVLLPDGERRSLAQTYPAMRDGEWREELTRELNGRYAALVGELLRSREIDLVVFDEAQYLRNVDNQQNTNIREVFCHSGEERETKWLFMSATPLHSSSRNITSLDWYLCTRNGGHSEGKACPLCASTNCLRAQHRLSHEVGQAKTDVVDLLHEFLVRRNRTYPDALGTPWGKVSYRKYQRVRVSAAKDPFLALATALVQKRLVRVLDGNNNVFRLGECSSFESLASSVRRYYDDRDGYRKKVPILEGGARRNKRHEPDETLDSRFINSLNSSFNKAMQRGGGQDGTIPEKYTLPHAKLHQEIGRLFNQNIRGASNLKSLVFVRRIETVHEFLEELMIRFQGEIDGRLEHWRLFLLADPGVSRREQPWKAGKFWSSRDKQEDAIEISGAPGHDPKLEEEVLVPGGNRSSVLPYFAALKRSRERGKPSGLLASFRARLRPAADPADNPLRGLLTPAQGTGASSEGAQGTASYWVRLVEAITSMGPGALKKNGRYRWMVTRDSPDGEDAKLAVLKRCILQSMRQTDFLVDLYVLNRFVGRIGPGKGEHTLPEKLLWFLGEGRSVRLPHELENHVRNWKAKLLHWLDHFDLIVDKTLRGKGATTWEEILAKVDDTFARMAPAAGRSSRITEKNTVKQFNFPTHPNVLVCTDVLKEGVDLHLFCDEVVHYGVAWTSGDLEQRIGRVDRFASLVSRRIGLHRDGAPPPQLTVEFPFLEGTLDEQQVRRVILEKFRNDRLMDLGQREEELKGLSLDDLEGADALLPGDFTERDAVAVHEFYPEGVPEEGPAGVDPETAFPLAPKLGAALVGWHVPAIRSVVQRRESADGDMLRRRWSGGRGRFIPIIEEEYVIPEASFEITTGEECGPSPSVESALMEMDPAGVQEHQLAGGFTFHKDFNTLVCRVPVRSPYGRKAERKQIVLLERVGPFWLLRTPVLESHWKDRNAVGSERWTALQNQKRRWGYLVKDQGIIWFVLFALAERIHDAKYLEQLGERVGKMGDRLQHLYLGMGKEVECSYRSHLPFPSERPTAAEILAACSKRKQAAGTTPKSSAEIGSRGFIKPATKWLLEAFREVVGALYGDDFDEDDWRLCVVQRTSKDGIVHFYTEGAERFAVQVFLELVRGPSGMEAAAVTRVIWELVVTPHLAGQRPQLPMSDWNDLSHGDHNSWGREQNSSCIVYTGSGDRYRHMAIYHTPQTWDRSRQSLLEAWSAIVDKMRSVNFQPAARKLFLDATAKNGQ